MLRTKDMLVFMGALLVLLVCIGVTYIRDTRSDLAVTPFVFQDSSTEIAAVYSAVAPSSVRDRQSTIAHLRSLLSKNKEEISSPDPSVEEVSLDTKESTLENKSTTILDTCTAADTEQQILQSYPLRFVSIEVKNAVRFVMYNPPFVPAVEPVTDASTTPSLILPNPVHALLTMPVFPQVYAKPNCVSGEIIGVTASGALLTNTDASSYLAAPTDELIGYARDGFPIYGPYEGKTDICGGYMHPEGYRYTLSEKRSFVLGCYVGTPLPFTL